VEVIEYLLLWAGVTTEDIENCTAEWKEAEAFVTKREILRTGRPATND
jgi:hypothetical protein